MSDASYLLDGRGLPGIALAAALLLCVFALGSLTAEVLLPRARASLRCTAAGVFGVWGLVVVFELLAAVGWFRVWLALPLVFAATALAFRSADTRQRVWHRWCADGRLAGSLLATRGGAMFGVALAIIAAVHADAVVLPQRGWDGLTYHLVHAGFWVTTGGFAGDGFPDAWGYYRHAPHAGDVVWGWAALTTRSFALVGLAGVLVHGMAGLAVFALARQLGGALAAAALVAVATVSMPAIAMFATSAYVDPLVVALVCGGCALLLHMSRETGPPSARLAFLAMAAFSVGAGAKASVLPGLAIAFCWLVWASRGADRAQLLRVFAAMALAGVVVLSVYGRTWWETGDPLYPADLHIGPLLLPGNHQFAVVHAGTRMPPGSLRTVRAGLSELFVGTAGPGFAHLNLGLGGVVLLILGFFGLFARLRPTASRLPTALLMAIAVMGVAWLASDGLAALRMQWWPVSGRLLAPSVAVVAAFGALHASRVGSSMRWLAVLLALGQLAVGGVGVEPAVERCRDPHPLVPMFAPERVWSQLDHRPPSRLAVVSGYAGQGQNAYLAPLFGRDLRHQLVHVPPSANGGVIDGDDIAALRAAGPPSVWLRRLRAAKVDAVVLLPPPNRPEFVWLGGADGDVRAQVVELPAR